MKKVFIVLGIIIVAILIAALITFGWTRKTYNTMVTMDETVNGAWAQVETVLQRRLDLIPNLVETVRGYAEHEEEVFIQVTEARSRVAGAATQDERIGAEQELSGALSRLLLVVENYPQLQANQNFLQLQDQLEGTENRIAVERRRYNEAVQQYNAYIRGFPQMFLARMFNFAPREFFEAAPEAATAPQVSFD